MSPETTPFYTVRCPKCGSLQGFYGATQDAPGEAQARAFLEPERLALVMGVETHPVAIGDGCRCTATERRKALENV